MTVRTLEEPPVLVSREFAERWRWAHAEWAAQPAIDLTEEHGAPAGADHLAWVLGGLLGAWVDAGLSEQEAETEARRWAKDVQRAIVRASPAAGDH